MVDVADGARGRHGLQVAVVKTVLHHRLAQRGPVLTSGQRHVHPCKQLTYRFGLGQPVARHIFFEEAAVSVLRPIEPHEGAALLLRQQVGGAQRVVGHRRKVHAGEIDAFRAAVMDALARQKAVQVHLPQPHGMGLVVAALDRRHAVDGRHARHGR